MYTIKDYLKFYKDISFEDVSFNEIDNILFSELSYLTWKGIVNNEKIKISKKSGKTGSNFARNF